MAKRGAYLLDDGTYARTQADAKASDQKFEKTSIPVDSDGLIKFINKIIEQERRGPNPPDNEQAPAAMSQTPEPPPPDPTPKKPTWAEQRQAEVDRKIAIDEEISNADYEESRRIQSLATERMVEHVARMQIEAKSSS